MQVDFDEGADALDPTVRSFWDLVPEINNGLLRAKLSSWGHEPEPDLQSPAPVSHTPPPLPNSSKKSPSSAAQVPSRAEGVAADSSTKFRVRTFEQKRDEIMAVWRRDLRFADLLDHDVVAVVDDEEGDTAASSGSETTDFAVFAEQHFLPNRGGLLSSPETPRMRASYATSLKKPLLLGADTGLAPASLKAFKKIMTYMGDRKSSKSSSQQCRELLESALRSPEAVRDEIFALICKQIHANPHPNNLVRGWRLLSLCTGFLATDSHRVIIRGTDSSVIEIREIAAYALRKLRSVLRNGARTVAASNPEIAASELRRPVVIKIWLRTMSSDSLRIAVESQTTARAVVKAIAVRLGITIPSAFGLSVPQRKTRRELAHYEKVLDIVSERLQLDAQSESNAETDLLLSKTGIDVEFAFNARLFQAARLPTYTDAELDLVFARIAEDVVAHRYPAEEKDYMALGVMHVYTMMVADKAAALPSNVDWVAAVVPAEILKKRTRPYLEQRLRSESAKLSDRSRRDVQLDYIHYTYRWETAGGTFIVGVRNQSDDDNEVVLCVSERGLHLVDPATRCETRLFPYSRIKTYGDVSGTMLNITSGTDHHEFRVQLETDESRFVHDLLQDYISVLAATYTQMPTGTM